MSYLEWKTYTFGGKYGENIESTSKVLLNHASNKPSKKRYKVKQARKQKLKNQNK